MVLIVVVVLTLGVYDIVAYVHGGVQATISRVVLGWAHANPVVAFAVGLLCGHLFWPQPIPQDPPSDGPQP
jgi:hypothetical protein